MPTSSYLEYCSKFTEPLNVAVVAVKPVSSRVIGPLLSVTVPLMGASFSSSVHETHRHSRAQVTMLHRCLVVFMIILVCNYFSLVIISKGIHVRTPQSSSYWFIWALTGLSKQDNLINVINKKLSQNQLFCLILAEFFSVSPSSGIRTVSPNAMRKSG